MFTVPSLLFPVREKHEAVAALKSSEDRIEATEAELEYLRVQLQVSGSAGNHHDDSSFNSPDSGMNTSHHKQT